MVTACSICIRTFPTGICLALVDPRCRTAWTVPPERSDDLSVSRTKTTLLASWGPVTRRTLPCGFFVRHFVTRPAGIRSLSYAVEPRSCRVAWRSVDLGVRTAPGIVAVSMRSRERTLPDQQCLAARTVAGLTRASTQRQLVIPGVTQTNK